MDKRLENILSDKKSGSVDLALKLNKYFKNNVQEPENFYELIKKINQKYSSFQIINNYLKKIGAFLKKNDFDGLNNFIDQFEDDILKVNERIYFNAKKYLLKCNSILTLSNSKTIAEVIKLLAKDKYDVKIFISESRPKMEGRILAKELLKNKIQVELIIDSAISEFIKNTDAVLIGADIILNNGNVINKVGSRSAAIIAMYYKKPFYVVASQDKFSKKTRYSPTKQDLQEVWDYQDKNLLIHNYYFEEVESKLITKIFSDD